MTPKRKLPYYRIFVTSMLVIALLGGLVVWTIYPKTVSSWPEHNPANVTVLQYIGLGLSEKEALYGMIPMTVSAPLSQAYGDPALLGDRQVVHLRRELVGRNPRLRKCRFEYIDTNGKLRAEGNGAVDFDGRGIVSFCLYRIDEASYFKPDGSIGSTIVDGNGKETWWNDDGSLFLEAVFESGFWVNTTFYDENGNVKQFAEYEEGKFVDWKRLENE